MRQRECYGQCLCGKKFYSAIAEARHRHNFPFYCKKKKVKNDKAQS